MALLSQKEREVDMFRESGYHVVRADDTQVESRFRENMAHIRQSKPDYGLDFQVKLRKPF